MHLPLSGGGEVFVPRSRALSYLRATKRTVYDYGDSLDDGSVGGGQRGLACECCVHQCTYNELLEYCQRGQRKRLALSAGTQADR